MSKSLNPWLHDYVLNIAQKYGAKIMDAPPYLKLKKIQFIEFLTQEIPGKNEEVAWVIVSDQKYKMPMKCTREALEQYYNRRVLDNFTPPSIYSLTYAIMQVANFRVIETRVPSRQSGRMSEETHLVLECNQLDIFASQISTTIGKPGNLEEDADLQVWLGGLRGSGGNGNVLKDRMVVDEGNSEEKEKSTARQSVLPVQKHPTRQPSPKKVISTPVARARRKDPNHFDRRDFDKPDHIRKQLAQIHFSSEDETDDMEKIEAPSKRNSPVKETPKHNPQLYSTPRKAGTLTDDASEPVSSLSRSSQKSVPLTDWPPTSPSSQQRSVYRKPVPSNNLSGRSARKKLHTRSDSLSSLKSSSSLHGSTPLVPRYNTQNKNCDKKSDDAVTSDMIDVDEESEEKASSEEPSIAKESMSTRGQIEAHLREKHSSPSEVTHDAAAWREPSFKRKRMSYGEPGPRGNKIARVEGALPRSGNNAPNGYVEDKSDITTTRVKKKKGKPAGDDVDFGRLPWKTHSTTYDRILRILARHMRRH